MNRLFYLALLHFSSIALFSVIYWKNHHRFIKNGTDLVDNYFDFLILSTTIQSGVGFNNLYPTTDWTKICVICQHFILLLENIIVLVLFVK